MLVFYVLQQKFAETLEDRVLTEKNDGFRIFDCI